MPELPEVETVRSGLEKYVVGKVINSVEIFHPRAIKPQSIAPLDTLVGSKIYSVKRRGKFLWFDFKKDFVLVAHLGMSGQLIVQKNFAEVHPHMRAKFLLGNKDNISKNEIKFIDQRTFGWLTVDEMVEGDIGLIPETCVHISLDPFDSNFDINSAAEEVLRRKSEIKRVLLNQEVVSGIGNIYADEALWLAKVPPETRVETLTKVEVIKILNSAKRVMSRALSQGGTSFDDLYINVNGESGYFEVSLRVYGREGELCTRCRTPIRRITFANLSSHFCPNCQKRGKSSRNLGPKSRRARG